jgi:hypothetical protein
MRPKIHNRVPRFFELLDYRFIQRIPAMVRSNRNFHKIRPYGLLNLTTDLPDGRRSENHQ